MNDREQDGKQVAWAGWLLRVPASWQMLRVHGDSGSGKMLLGPQRPGMQVSWQRMRASQYEAERWVRRRLRFEGGGDVETPASGPWAVTGRGERTEMMGLQRTRWCGYAAGCELALEVVFGLPGREEQSRELPEKVIGSIEAAAWGEWCPWSIYGASFRSPPGWELGAQQTQEGDVTLGFSEDDRRLILRQVWPVAAALERRSRREWLEGRLVPERRRFIRDGEPRPWEIELDDGVRQGRLVTGEKRMLPPLGRLGTRRSMRVAVIDGQTDRLLLAELDSRDGTDQADQALIREAMQQMGPAAD